MLATLLPVIISAVIAALGKLVLDLHSEQESYDKGHTDAVTTIAKGTADADRRASQAQVDAPRGAHLDDALVSGGVRF